MRERGTAAQVSPVHCSHSRNNRRTSTVNFFARDSSTCTSGSLQTQQTAATIGTTCQRKNKGQSTPQPRFTAGTAATRRVRVNTTALATLVCNKHSSNADLTASRVCHRWLVLYLSNNPIGTAPHRPVMDPAHPTHPSSHLERCTTRVFLLRICAVPVAAQKPLQTTQQKPCRNRFSPPHPPLFPPKRCTAKILSLRICAVPVPAQKPHRPLTTSPVATNPAHPPHPKPHLRGARPGYFSIGSALCLYLPRNPADHPPKALAQHI
jgi:hypothetical protein